MSNTGIIKRLVAILMALTVLLSLTAALAEAPTQPEPEAEEQGWLKRFFNFASYVPLYMEEEVEEQGFFGNLGRKALKVVNKIGDIASQPINYLSRAISGTTVLK